MFRFPRFLLSPDRKFLKKHGSDTTAVPYHVKRTAEGNLPIYAEKRRKPDRTFEVVTKVGGLYGDSDSFAADAKLAVGATKVSISRRKAVLTGDLVEKLKQWLHKSGF